MSEHEIEPIPGLPDYLPPGERLLWQGAPHWRPLAMRAFRLREVMIYFAVLMAWRGLMAALDGGSFLVIMDAVLSLAPLALGAVAILLVIATLSARTTMYSITDRRIVMRIGMALPITLNIPFEGIDGAAVVEHKDQSGDITLSLNDNGRIGYLVLWPHVRPWRYARPEPMLRALADPRAAVDVLGRALAGYVQPKPVVIPQSPEEVVRGAAMAS